MKTLDWQQLDESQRDATLARPTLSQRETVITVPRIMAAVQERGDEALREYSQRFDHVYLPSFKVSGQEFETAETQLADKTRAALKLAASNIETFHRALLPQAVGLETASGVYCQSLPRPLQAVGLYAPAGSAPLPSTVLMLGIPARLANCPVRILCTPPRPDGSVDPIILAAASLCGIEQVFKLGGAQAIAAMAYGTASIPRVDKLFGPGNAWVTAAKQYAASHIPGIAIDMPAGPSEVLVIADETARPDFVAADLLSQAEHGPDSQVLLVTPSQEQLKKTREAMKQQLDKLPRAAIARQALQHARAILAPDIKTALAISNRYAPEHLIIQTKNARDFLDEVTNAGSVFLGAWTPESLGDYVSGTNHVLPTAGYARSFSGLTVSAFMKTLLVQEAQSAGLATLGQAAIELATVEGLQAHASAVTLRLAALESNTLVADTEQDNVRRA